MKPDHFGLWEEHRPTDLLGIFFPEPETYAQLSLVDALLPAGAGEDGHLRLIREAVAAILNAAHESLEYPFSRYGVGIGGRPPIIPTVASLLREGKTDEMASFAAELAAANGLGCPLSATTSQ